MLADRLEHIRARERFHPGLFALFVNPFFLARRGLFVNVFPLGRYIRGKVLDVGCGEKPYERICNADQYIGLEIDTPENRKKKKADFFYDGNTFPFQGAEFDSVVTSQVFEHVFNPDQFLSEIYRVLKPGGMLLLTVPFVWDEAKRAL